MNKKYILAADIGGTNSRFAIFELGDKKNLVMKGKIWLKTKEANSFEQLLSQLKDSDFKKLIDKIDITVIAVAGPVKDNLYSSPPYISWDVDLTKAIDKELLKNAYLINDFLAQGYATISPVGKKAIVVISGTASPLSPIGVIGAGTALGKAILVPVSKGYEAIPSEGGHSYFPFINKREFEFLQFCRQETNLNQITENIVVSGRGMKLIHFFLTNEDLSPEEITKRLDKYPETLKWMARFYGRICRDFALNIMCLGGLYIAGGVAARNPEIVMNSAFSEEFLNSETMSHILKQIPVYLITDQDSGLWGAAVYGVKKLTNN